MRGLWIPFQRDRAHDLATATGPALLRAKVLQVLCTQGAGPSSGGELPWRTRFGAGLESLRHQRNDRALTELARVRIDEALRRWLPSVQVCDLHITREDATLHIHLRVRQPPAHEARLEVII
jgi:phage baseplate assembly protein W